jgi:hypothetical protein
MSRDTPSRMTRLRHSYRIAVFLKFLALVPSKRGRRGCVEVDT